MHNHILEANDQFPLQADNVVVDALSDGDAHLTDLHSGQTYHLNRTSFAIWRLCDGRSSVNRIAQGVTQEYDVQFDVAVEDVQRMLNGFKASKVIQ